MITKYIRRVAKSNKRVTQDKVYETFWEKQYEHSKKNKCFITDDNGNRMHFYTSPKYWVEASVPPAVLVKAAEKQIGIYKTLAEEIQFSPLTNCRCVACRVPETKRECIDRQINKANKEYVMKIEKVTVVGSTKVYMMVNGINTDTYNADHFIELIKEEEANIETLKTVTAKSNAISRKIKTHEANIEALVELLDESSED